MNFGHYISVIFTASVLGAVCAVLAGSAFEPYIRYLAALACILLIVHPFRSFSFDMPEQENSLQETTPPSDSLQTLAEELAKEEICRAIGDTLYVQTGITASTVSIDMEWTEQDVLVTAVHLTLAQKEHALSAQAWIERAYGVPCEAVWEGGTA